MGLISKQALASAEGSINYYIVYTSNEKHSTDTYTW